MKMNLTIIHERKQSIEKVAFNGKNVRELLQHLQLSPEAVIVVRDKEVLTENELLSDKDKIQLLSVISGG